MSDKKGFEKFLVVTTPILDGVEIQEYLGLVVVRDVRAVNIIRDFLTGFRDILGGKSGSYQELIDQMYDELLAEFRQKAQGMGASAIVGFRMDFESVSAKNTSLIMATAQGTAVRI